MPVVTCIEDLRQLSRKRVARAIFDYVDRGSYTESTLRANRADLELLTLRQRVGIDVDKRSTRGTMLGEEVSMPVGLAPVGLTGLNWADGEIPTFSKHVTAHVGWNEMRATTAADHMPSPPPRPGIVPGFSLQGPIPIEATAGNAWPEWPPKGTSSPR